MSRYWLTPQEVYAALDAEFAFDCDPCPYPRPDEYNSLVMPWGASNYVNPPFCRKDAPFGGPSAFARKAIAEQAQGKTSVMILPVPNSIGLLLEAGAELRYGGKIRWIEADTGEPCPRAWRQVIAILRGRLKDDDDAFQTRQGL
jgi:hypothetical protein